MLFLVDDSIPYLELTLSLIIITYVVHTYLDLRQVQCLRKSTIPSVVEEVLKKEEFLKMRSYFLHKWSFNMTSSFIDCVQTLVMLNFKILPLLWYLTRQLAGQLGRNFIRSEVFCNVVFIGMFVLGSYMMKLPWSFYRTLVLDRGHGLNKQTVETFIIDNISLVLLGAVCVPLGAALVTVILPRTDAQFLFCLWLCTVALMIFSMTIYPNVIAPVIYKFSPLSSGTLKSKIEKLARQVNLSLKGVYIMDGSKRNEESYGYVYGLFSKKYLVISDTLTKKCNDDEVMAMIACEFGHWKMSHELYKALTLEIIFLTQFVLFGFIRNSQELHNSFGFTGETPIFTSLILFYSISSRLSLFIDFGHHLLTRKLQFSADAFSVHLGLGSDLKKALIVLEKTNKRALNADKWYSAFHYGNPLLVERLREIDKRFSKTL